MTDQYLQNVNDRKILLQEALGEPICEYIILEDRLKNLRVAGMNGTPEEQAIRDNMQEVIHSITQIITS